MKQTRLVAIVLLALISALFVGCDSNSAGETAAPINILPVTGFNSGVGTAGLGTSQVEIASWDEKVSYFTIAPAITGFVPNEAGVPNNGSYTVEFLGETYTVNIIADSSTVNFAAEDPDDNGYMSLQYRPADDTFNYEQMLYINDTVDDPNDDFEDTVVFVRITGGTVDRETGHFRGPIEAFAVRDSGFMGSKDGEIYYGDLGSGYNQSGAVEDLGVGMGMAFYYSGQTYETHENGDPAMDVSGTALATWDVGQMGDGGAYETAFDALDLGSRVYPMISYRTSSPVTFVDVAPDPPASSFAEWKLLLPDSWETASDLTAK